MFKIEYENMNFINIMKYLSDAFVELPIVIDNKGLSIVASSQGAGAVVSISMGKDDHKSFSYDNKKPTSFVLPFGEFMNVTNKITAPVEFSDDGVKIGIKSGKAKFLVDKLADADIQAIITTCETIKKNRSKTGATEVIINASDIAGLISLLEKISGNGIKFVAENGKMHAESAKQLAIGSYEFDTVVDKKFTWTGVISPNYVKLIKNLGSYSGKIHFHFNSVPEEDILYAVVEFPLGANSSASLVVAFLKDYNITPGIAASDEEVESEYNEDTEESEEFDEDEDDLDTDEE